VDIDRERVKEGMNASKIKETKNRLDG
jgi:hypothetical protein